MYHQYEFTSHYLFISLLIILSLNMFYRKQHFSLSNRWFLRLTASMIILLILEIFSWRFEGLTGDGYRRIHLVLRFIFYLSNLFVPLIWLNYIDFKIFRSLTRLRKRLYYGHFLFTGIVMLAVNLKTGWIYTISQANIYETKLSGIIIFTIFMFSIIYAPVLIIIWNRKRIDPNIIIANFFFAGLPFMAAALQIATGSTLLVWNSVALAIVAIYIFLELSNLTCDSLTGLDNRKQMEEWLYFKSSSGNNFTLIMLDLNDFKQVNDQFGHSEGDQALIHFANILKSSVKHNDHIARFAGDEFLIGLETGDRQIAEKVIQRLHKKLDDFNRKGITPYPITCSCGTAVYSPSCHSSYEMAVKEADEKMYEDKHRRKKRNQEITNTGNS